MAFGKKKDEEPAAAEAEPQDDLTGAFAAPAAEPVAGATAEAAAPAEAEAPPPAEAATPAPAAAGSPDALLSMFQDTQQEEDDRSALLDLAGDVAIEDLLEELHTLCAALGIEPVAVAA